jgi:hypothetical protein
MARPCILSRRLMPGQPWPVATAHHLHSADSRTKGCDSVCVSFTPSPTVTSGHEPLVRAGQGRWPPVVNGGAQSSKACEGATPPWAQIPPPPPLTRHDPIPQVPRSACPESFCLSFWPPNGRCARSGLRFLPAVGRAASAPPARIGLQHLRGGVRGITSAPRVLWGSGHVEREPAGPSTTTYGSRALVAADALCTRAQR